MIGPGEIALDSAGVFTMDMFLKLRSDKVTVSLIGPTDLEDVIAVGNLGVSSKCTLTGKNQVGTYSFTFSCKHRCVL